MYAYNPMAHFIVPSDEVSWDSDIPILADLYWGTGVSEFSITSPQSVTIMNSGSVATKLSYTLEGTGTNLTVSANGKSFSLGTFTNAKWEIQGDEYSILKNGVYDMSNYTGDFIELLPGENLVRFSGTNLNLLLSESNTFKYV
jgi:hypothetical protein